MSSAHNFHNISRTSSRSRGASVVSFVAKAAFVIGCLLTTASLLSSQLAPLLYTTTDDSRLKPLLELQETTTTGTTSAGGGVTGVAVASQQQQQQRQMQQLQEQVQQLQEQLREKDQQVQNMLQQQQQQVQVQEEVQVQVQQQEQQNTAQDNDFHWNDKSNGWSLIHVFYGTRKHLGAVSDVRDPECPQRYPWSAQGRQDELVSKLLRSKRNGYFVDIAANDPVRHSNTYALETYHDWSGICIEANAHYWPGLSYRKCHVVGAVVGNDREEVSFKFSANELGGIVGHQFDNKGGGEQPRMTVQMLEIFQRFDTPKVIDYLSLDVEGAEHLVLVSSLLEQYRFKIITIERPKEELMSRLASHDYLFLKEITHWGEKIFAHKDFESELDKSAFNDVDTWSFQYYQECN